MCEDCGLQSKKSSGSGEQSLPCLFSSPLTQLIKPLSTSLTCNSLFYQGPTSVNKRGGNKMFQISCQAVIAYFERADDGFFPKVVLGSCAALLLSPSDFSSPCEEDEASMRLKLASSSAI